MEAEHLINNCLRIQFDIRDEVADAIKQNANFSKIKKCYSINLAYYDFGKGEDYLYYGKMEFRGVYKNDVLLLRPNQQEKYKMGSFGEIEKEYHLVKVQNFDNVIKNTLDEWIYFFKNHFIDDSYTAKGIIEAKDVLKIYKLSDQERSGYNNYWENKRLENSLLDTAIFEGQRMARNQRLYGELIMKTLKKGWSISDISKFFDLDDEEVIEIIKYNMEMK